MPQILRNWTKRVLRVGPSLARRDEQRRVRYSQQIYLAQSTDSLRRDQGCLFSAPSEADLKSQAAPTLKSCPLSHNHPCRGKSASVRRSSLGLKLSTLNLPLARGLLIAACLFLPNQARSQPRPPLPDLETLFPQERLNLDASNTSPVIDVNIDGTLSMQGFAKPASGGYAQLLMDVDRSLANLWGQSNTRYYKFGAKSDPITQRPVYLEASRLGFYSGSGNYAKTRIDEVLRRGTPSALTVVVTDLYQQDMNIEAIQDAIRRRQFPRQAALGVWRWMVSFDGTIYDYALGKNVGQRYAGLRPLYILAVAPEPILKQWKKSLDQTLSGTKPDFLAISSNLVENPNSWLRIEKTERLARKKSDLTANIPYTILRPSANCSDAILEVSPSLRPSTFSAISFTPGINLANIRVDLFAVVQVKDKTILDPRKGVSATLEGASDRNSHKSQTSPVSPNIRIVVDCLAFRNETTFILRVREIASPEAFSLPAWVALTSVTSAQINDLLARRDPLWGQRTLNLFPFVSDMVASAMRDATVASSYFYLVRN